MEKSEQEKIKNYLVDTAALETFDFLHSRFMETLPDEDILEFTAEYTTWLKAWVDFENPDMESPAMLAKLMEIEWNEGMYLFYIDTYGTDVFDDSINEDDTILGLMGVVSGVHRSIKNLQDLQRQLESGKELDDLYKHQKAGVSFIQTNGSDIEHSKSQLYKDLINGYKQMVELQPDNVKSIVANDVKEFGRLFESGQSNLDWSYLAERMYLSVTDVESIYQERNGVLMGSYKFNQFSFDRDKRLNYAILLGVQDYIKFITNSLPKESTTKSNDDPYFKLVLKTEGVDTRLLNMNLRKSYDILIDEGVIEGNYSDYKSIFLIDFPLNRKIKWLTERKELKYFVCMLASKDFTEKVSKSSGYTCTTEGSGTSVFVNEIDIFNKAGNSFLSKQGKIPSRGVEISNGTTPLSKERKQLFDRIAELFTSL